MAHRCMCVQPSYPQKAFPRMPRSCVRAANSSLSGQGPILVLPSSESGSWFCPPEAEALGDNAKAPPH